MSRSFADKPFHIVPAWIVQCRRFSRVEQIVCSVLYSKYKIANEKPFAASVRGVSIWAAIGWGRARKAMDKLIELEVLEVEDGLYRVVCPDWLYDEMMAASTLEGSIATVEGGSTATVEGNGVEWSIATVEGGSTATVEGGLPLRERTPLSRGESKKKREEGKKTSEKNYDGSHDPSGDPVVINQPVDEDLEDGSGEEEVPIPDGDSPSLKKELERTKSKKGKKKKLKKVDPPRAPSGKEFLNRCSERWEFDPNRNRVGRATRLVGYWARSYRATFGKEDPDFRFPTIESESFLRISGNVRRFVDTFLDGDWDRAKADVDMIMKFGEPLGYPIVMRYFFTPSMDNVMRALRDRRRRDGKTLTPIESDDLAGGDKTAFDDMKKRAAARRTS